MAHIKNWRADPVQVAQSAGGVCVLADAWENVIKTGVRPWPPPELIQKIYQSRQVRAFEGAELELATSFFGFYSDLQSIHSEDAITWSFFGPLIYGPPETREEFTTQLLATLDVGASSTNAHVWLWRRLPHPETLVPGGPEIDFGIQTDDVFLLGEAKWRSSVGVAQGVNRDKDQITLRREFCEKYGARLLPTVKHFIVLGVSWRGGIAPQVDSEEKGIGLHSRDLTWKELATSLPPQMGGVRVRECRLQSGQSSASLRLSTRREIIRIGRSKRVFERRGHQPRPAPPRL